jgi:nucleotide-binding universal stress UspA family protein
MYKRVLVAVDGSETAEAILPFIVQLAGPLDLDVILLRANLLTPAVEFVAARMISEVYLADLAKDIAGHGLRVETVVRDGAPADTILAVAREQGADLIAMTTHGRTGPSRLLFGSVAEAVLRESSVPVLLLKQSERDLARRRTDGGSQ